ncbi:MAG: hypothetical protein ACR2K4_03250 [Candidatus Limnocylindria bacterium]
MTATQAGTMRWPIVVRLARDPFRLIGWLLFRLAVGEIGAVVGLSTPGILGTTVTIASTAVLLYVAALSVHVLSLRIEVHPGEVHAVAWPVRHRYRVAGGHAERFRSPLKRRSFGTALGSFGLEIGPGLIGGRDEVDVIRLDPAASIVLVRAGATRLAIAPSSEAQLRRALQAAGVTVGDQESPPAPR